MFCCVWFIFPTPGEEGLGVNHGAVAPVGVQVDRVGVQMASS